VDEREYVLVALRREKSEREDGRAISVRRSRTRD
jgi:hypothetical protein